MFIKCAYLYDTGSKAFGPTNEDADVLVYVNSDLGDSGTVLVTAVRKKDHRHFNWVLSENTTVKGLAEIADRFAKS